MTHRTVAPFIVFLGLVAGGSTTEHVTVAVLAGSLVAAALALWRCGSATASTAPPNR